MNFSLQIHSHDLEGMHEMSKSFLKINRKIEQIDILWNRKYLDYWNLKN